jgi:hypothetical protein
MVRRLMRLSRVFAVCAVGAAGPAAAGGYDTPMLYNAETMGLGGASNAGVADPSALFHNPAGLAGIDGFEGLLDISFLTGTVTGSPANSDAGRSLTSEPTQAPFFLAGFGGKVFRHVHAGFAIFPIASAGGTYRYNDFGNEIVDSTKLVFLEMTPGIAVELPGRLHLGVGYRYTTLSLSRYKGPEGQADDGPAEGPAGLKFELKGTHASGLRAGLQWRLMEDPKDATGLTRNRLHLGVSYRHRIIVEVAADAFRALGQPGTDARSTFTLPSRLIAGVRADIKRYGVALDVERGFNSQNEVSSLAGTVDLFGEVDVANVFGWQDATTVRAGFEVRAGAGGRCSARLGYVYDEATSNRAYPTAFGTPAAPTQVLTAGAGYDAGPWAVNLALARRTGSTTITTEDLASGTQDCPFCGATGDYAIDLKGIYVDFRYRMR